MPGRAANSCMALMAGLLQNKINTRKSWDLGHFFAENTCYQPYFAGLGSDIPQGLRRIKVSNQ